MLQAFTKRLCLLTVMLLLFVVNALAEDVARIGTVYYTSLEGAFAAAKDGETIQLLRDCSGNGIIVPEGKFKTTGLTVNFAYRTYTVNGTTLAGSAGTKTQAFQLLKDNKITFTNGAIVGNNANVKMLIQNYSDLTLDKMTLDANEGKNSVNYVLSTNNGNTVIRRTTITAKDNGKAFDVCSGWGNYLSNSVELAGYNNVINGDVEVSYLGQNDGTPSVLKLTDGTLNGNIVMAQGADKCTVTKAVNLAVTAPAGYVWTANEDGLIVLGPDVIEIGSVKELEDFRDEVNKGVEYPVDGAGGKYPNGNLVGKTIKLTADLDLQGKEWTPINLNVYDPWGGIHTVFDGNNHTISNLTISSQPDLNKGVGLFSYLRGTTLKNLTLKNVNIKGNKKVGAFVAGEDNVAQIDNCHLDGGTIIASVVINDDEADEGNNVGGIVGYLGASHNNSTNSSVTKCSVKNVTIQGYRDMGSIVGTFDTGTFAESEISGCSAENVTLIQDYTIDYKANVAPLQSACNIHEIVGRVLGTNTIEHNTFKNVTITTGTIANDKATITNVEIAQEGVKNVTVSAAIGSADVTEIAEGAFASLPNTVQTIDLSSTKVELSGERKGHAVLGDIPETALIYLPSTSSVSGTNVVIKDKNSNNYTCESLLMKDKQDYSVPTPFTAATATFDRVFNEGQYSTICLPFDVPKAKIPGKIYSFTKVEGSNVIMTEETGDYLQANVPYILTPSKGEAIDETSNVTVQMDNAATLDANGTYSFIGVYEKYAFTDKDYASGAVYGYSAQTISDKITAGTFVKFAGDSYVPGMRAYLKYTGGTSVAPGIDKAPADLPQRLNVILRSATGETTDILGLDLTTDESGAPVYNLSGQRVNNPEKGIYIKNGKKVIIK